MFSSIKDAIISRKKITTFKIPEPSFKLYNATTFSFIFKTNIT